MIRHDVENLTGEIRNLNLQESEKQIMRKGSGSIIICDAWYGFPTQKRPRRERILAVSKQIHNFLRWRGDHVNVNEKNHMYGMSTVLVIGKDGDVQAIRQRVEELRGKDAKTDNGNDCHCDCDCKMECIYLPGMQLEDLSKDLLASEMTAGQEEIIAYLSPDATEQMKASEVPPRIVVVGMLVDRKVQPNRSKIRAQSLNQQSSSVHDDESSTHIRDLAIIPMQLPLDVLNVSDVSTDEPLNIDTVLELMERWWMNIKLKNGDSETNRKLLFRDAAARALLTHRQRHPNRTIHGGASESNK
jgi:hypothetical protein